MIDLCLRSQDYKTALACAFIPFYCDFWWPQILWCFVMVREMTGKGDDCKEVL